MNIMSLINALPGAAAQGLIWGIMAIGVYLTFRILDVADLTVDGTMCTGGAVCVMMLMSGHNIWVSMLAQQVPECLPTLQQESSTHLWESYHPPESLHSLVSTQPTSRSWANQSSCQRKQNTIFWFPFET